MALCLIDVASIYWPGWFMHKSGIRACDAAYEKLDWYRREYPRTVICADSPFTKRKAMCETYKAQREPRPPEAYDGLVSLLQRFADQGVPVVERPGYEGEDIVASLCEQAFPEEVVIVGIDKDLMPLISETVTVAHPKGRMGVNECFEKWGCLPSQFADFLAMTGDASDGIQGCTGVGPGRAADLLTRFGSLEGIRAATDEELLSVRKVGKTTLASLREWDPTMAVKLVTLMKDAPVRLEELWLKG